jgi:hypothetical protein
VVAAAPRPAASAAGIHFRVRWHPPEPEGLLDVLRDRLLNLLHLPPGLDETPRDRIIGQGVAMMLEIGDLRRG